MPKITPHLWFDTQAGEAAKFYTSIFQNSHINTNVTLKDTPSGDANLIEITLESQDFMLINAGPYFKFNPSISFTVACKTEQEVDELWSNLVKGGQVLMELGVYPFSPKYGWLQDKFGVSWQISMAMGEVTQKITPSLLFVGKVYGKAKNAMELYTSVFPNSEIKMIAEYQQGEGDKTGMVKYGAFSLDNTQFVAMDSGFEHKFDFNEAISFVVSCKDQAEIDYYWEKLSFVPESEQCGWLKDKFGVSWQIVPEKMGKMMQTASPEIMQKLTQSFLKMKKFDLAELERVYNGG